MAKVKINRKLFSSIKSEMQKEVVYQTEDVRNETVALILETPKSGRIYTRRGVSHKASAPGEPFASDTGATLSQIRTDYEDDGLTGKIIGNENHARLEFGTEKMDARPSLRPASAKQEKAIERGFNNALKRGIKKAQK